jgi:CBS domain-containing protein
MHDAPLKARDISPDLLVTVKGEATLEEAAALMLQMDIGSLLVVDGHGKLIGIITDADFGVGPTHAPGATGQPEVLGHIVRKDVPVEQIYHAARTRRVRDVMSTPVVTVEEDDSIDTVVGRMFQNRIRHVPVVRHGRPVGMVSSRDLLQLLFAKPAAPG